MASFKTFEEIQAWQESKSLALKIYEVTNEKSFNRDFDLARQMRRCAISISSNIAEGFERQTTKEFIQFLFIAKGSSAELRSQLYLAHELGYIKEEKHLELLDKSDHVSKMIGNLIKYLRSTLNK